MRGFKWALLGIREPAAVGCGYNTLQVQDEQIKSAWSEVVNQYQRRADLIPNLVATVKGFAAQEQAVLIGVTEAPRKGDADPGQRRTIPPRWPSSRPRKVSSRAHCRD
jgi:hypothetical protein